MTQNRRNAVHCLTDSTTAPRPRPPAETSDIFDERFMAARHEEECYEKNIFTCFFVCKGLSNGDVRVTRRTVLQKIRPDAGFKPGYFVEK